MKAYRGPLLVRLVPYDVIRVCHGQALVVNELRGHLVHLYIINREEPFNQV
jgi:hypothetical protein